MKKFVDNNYGKDMINAYRGLLFSNLERSRAKDIEDVEAMNFVPQAAYGLSFNPLEYGIIPEAKNDTGIKLGDVINGAVGTQIGRYFQYSPKYEQTKIKFQPGKGKTIREKSAPMGYAYSREILDPWGGNYMFETTKKTEQTTPPTFVDSDVSTFNLPTIPDVTDFNYGKFGGRFACGGLKKYDRAGKVSPAYIKKNFDGTITYIGSDGNKYFGNGRMFNEKTKKTSNYDNNTLKFKFDFDKNYLDKLETNKIYSIASERIGEFTNDLQNVNKNNGYFDGNIDYYKELFSPHKILERYANSNDDNNTYDSLLKYWVFVDETKPKQDVTGSTGTGSANGTGATVTNGTTPSASTTGTGTPESNAPATNTPATNTPTTGTTTTPSQQVVTDTKLPLGYAAFNYGNRLWGSYNKDAVLDNDRLLRYDAGDNGIHIRYQRIPRKEWSSRNNKVSDVQRTIPVYNGLPQSERDRIANDVVSGNLNFDIHDPAKINWAKQFDTRVKELQSEEIRDKVLSEPNFACGGRKMALGGPDYMNVDTELTDVVNEDVINRNLNKAFINGQWVDLTDQSTVRDAKIAQPRRDNWWATDMALWDGAKLAANVYDAIQQNKQNNGIRSVDDIAFTNYLGDNYAYLSGSDQSINGAPVGLENKRNQVYTRSAFGGKLKCGGTKRMDDGGNADDNPKRKIKRAYANYSSYTNSKQPNVYYADENPVYLGSLVDYHSEPLQPSDYIQYYPNYLTQPRETMNNAQVRNLQLYNNMKNNTVPVNRVVPDSTSYELMKRSDEARQLMHNDFVNRRNAVMQYYQNGGVYDLTPDEIREIYANGGRVEFLD